MGTRVEKIGQQIDPNSLKTTTADAATTTDFEKKTFDEKFGLHSSDWNSGIWRFNIAETNGGILSIVIKNNKTEIIRTLEEIRAETEKRLHEARPKNGTPAQLFFYNAFKSLNLLEMAMTEEKGFYIEDISNYPFTPTAPDEFDLGVFNVEKPDRIYIRSPGILSMSLEVSEEIKMETKFFQRWKTKLEKSIAPEDRSTAQAIDPVYEAEKEVKDKVKRRRKETRRVVYTMLHETTHYVWVRENEGSFRGSDTILNHFATELMAYGVMAVAGLVEEGEHPLDVPEGFGPDQKFYQTVLRKKHMREIGEVFLNQLSRRSEDNLVKFPVAYKNMTSVLAGQLPNDLSYTCPAGLAAKIPIIGPLIDRLFSWF